MSSDWTLRDKPIVAVGLLTADDLKTLGSSFNRAWPVDDAPCFDGLLEAIDEADRGAIPLAYDPPGGGAGPRR